MQDQRSLNFNLFLQQRAKQISAFTSIIQADTKKRGHQGLPKSIRRRAMSHNRYRVPLKIRQKFQKQLKQNQALQKLPKCRKHIRKRHKLINSYKQRFSKIRWLSTHLWNAKRMHMKQMFGYKIAQSPHDKCFRSSYRQYRHNCCLMDFSYLQEFTISFIKSNIDTLNIFQKLRQLGIQSNENKILSSKQYQRGNVYNIEKKLICPLIIFIQNNQDVVHCFFHPTAKQQLIQKFKLLENIIKNKCQVNFTRGQSEIYLLLGPSSLGILKDVLQYQNYKLLSQQSHNKNTIIFNPYYFLHNQIIYLSQSKKQKDNQKIITSPYSQIIKQNYQQNQNEELRKKILAQFQFINKQNSFNSNNQNNKQEKQSFWQFYRNQISFKDQFTFQFTTRSKYTHKRTNKFTKQNKKKIVQAKKGIKLKEKKQEIKVHPQKQIVQTNLKAFKNNQKIQIIVTKNSRQQSQKIINNCMISIINENNFYQGCYLFCSKSQNCKIWRLLTQKHVKVIGRKQYRQLMLQSNAPVFPEDYPQTKSFQVYNELRKEKQYKRCKNRPPQKRINFLKIRSPFPFTLNPKSFLQSNKKLMVNQNIHLRFINVEMIGKGRCFQGSYIIKMNKKDLQQAYKQINDKGKVSIIGSETKLECQKYLRQEQTKGNKIQIDYKKMSKQQISNKLKDISIGQQRQIIGFITSGGVIYSKSRQGGIGYIIQDNNSLLQQNEYVLIRKPSSRHYYIGYTKTIVNPCYY